MRERLKNQNKYKKHKNANDKEVEREWGL